MEMEEAKTLVKKELERVGKFFDVKEDVRGSVEHCRFTNDDIDVSIQEFFSERQEYVNVYLDFELNGLNYQITSFNTTPDAIVKLFAEYKRIKGE